MRAGDGLADMFRDEQLVLVEPLSAVHSGSADGQTEFASTRSDDADDAESQAWRRRRQAPELN